MKKNEMLRLGVLLGFLIAFSFALTTFAASSSRGYSIQEGNTRVYADKNLTSATGWIYDTDEVSFLSITEDSMRVRYPVSGGKTRTGYVYPQSFLLSLRGQSYGAGSRITTYIRPGGRQYGYVDQGDTVLVLGKTGDWVQLQYPVSSGYKLAFVAYEDYCRAINPSDMVDNAEGPTRAQGGSQVLPDGWYVFLCSNNQEFCLDIHNYSLENGGNLEVYYKRLTDNQIFYVKYLRNGYYSLMGKQSGKYLHVQSQDETTSNVHQWEGEGHTNAHWIIHSVGNGAYQLQSRSTGSYLDNLGGNTTPANNVWTYPYNNSFAQTFVPQRVSFQDPEPAVPQTNKRQALVQEAKSHLGKLYGDFPSSLGFHFRAWCADFVSYCAKQVGAEGAIPANASVTNLRSAIKRAGGREYSKSTLQKGNYTPQRGDIIIFKSNGASHVGIVDYAQNSVIYYIDGNNTSNGNGYKACVHSSKCSYSYSKFTCVLSPAY